ncbi:DUF4129 domain-containing transglutaminase family protein [Salsuginibacillus kocurii]|uniref:DUF4129 domain-containing transglutaminase family protein n=1 Tax=Salsuginibacillus kocurii TaxID=427078 RepID=UPI0003823101|nr:transglutaminase domain-containing protein [Salsuginibacillus kocurii]
MRESMRTPRHALIYILGFLLLMEWLVPLPVISDTGYIPIFMLMTAIYFLIMFLRLPFYVTIPLLGLVSLYGLHHIFMPEPFLTPAWWAALFADIQSNISLLLNGNWQLLSEKFRSFLFLLLLAIMSYLIYFWVVYVKRVFFFFIFTVAYVAVVDSFTVYEANMAMIRIFVLGFLLLGLLQAFRMVDEGGVRQRGGLMFRWVTGTVVIVLAAGLAGMAAPKAEPQWPDPVPFIENAAGIEDYGDGSGGPQRIGYGDNDERLGGGFEMDDSPVFEAEMEETSYWRGESKNIYTGHGWENDYESEEGNFDLYTDNVETEDVHTNVEMAEGADYPLVFYPGDLDYIDPGENPRFENVSLDPNTGMLERLYDTEPEASDSFTINYEAARFPIERMRDVEGTEQDEAHIQEDYLQLPNSLPERVEDLAHELTDEYGNRYDKARAVEDYLSGPEFTYDTENVAVPSSGEDYVDQFLFETQRGYCDNFSTSMVVLMRALDIPARWVKGFTPGEEIEFSSGYTTREITNANAHSWVEVYFPEVGWVPFEPTQGFSSTFDYYFEEHGESSEEWEAEANTETEQPDSEEEHEETEEEEDEEVAAGSGTNGWWMIALGAGIVALLALLAAKYRHRLIRAYLLRRYPDFNEKHSFVSAYESLLGFLKFAGLARGSEETLREYAARVDHTYQTKAMETLTSFYERQYYGRKEENQPPLEVKRAWEQLVARIES